MVSYDVMEKMISVINTSEHLKNELKGWKKSFVIKTDLNTFNIIFQDDGSVLLSKGDLSQATAIISSPDKLMEDILMGKEDGVKSYFAGNLKITGDLFQAQRLVAALKKTGG